MFTIEDCGSFNLAGGIPLFLRRYTNDNKVCCVTCHEAVDTNGWFTCYSCGMATHALTFDTKCITHNPRVALNSPLAWQCHDCFYGDE